MPVAEAASVEIAEPVVTAVEVAEPVVAAPKKTSK
jgi:hypothetical protein